MTEAIGGATAQRRLQDILDAIGRTRVADKRMLLAQNLADDVGVTIAFQAILHNLTVIGDAVRAIPEDVLARDPGTPGAVVAALPDLIAPDYLNFAPAEIHRVVEEALEPLDVAVRRLRARR